MNKSILWFLGEEVILDNRVRVQRAYHRVLQLNLQPSADQNQHLFLSRMPQHFEAPNKAAQNS